MNRIVCGFFLALASFVRLSSADTLTLRNNAEINGKISDQDGAFTITARYRSETKTAKFDRADVRTVEINARDFNPGEPPKDLSIFVYHSASTRDASDQKTNSLGNNKTMEKPTGVKHS